MTEHIKLFGLEIPPDQYKNNQNRVIRRRVRGGMENALGGELEREFKHGEESGMTFALKKLRGTDGIGVHEFGEKDIVRNPIIGAILKKFNGDIDK
jgi:hypothetical protein